MTRIGAYIREWLLWWRVEKMTLRLLTASYELRTAVRLARDRGYEIDGRTGPGFFLTRAAELEQDFTSWLREREHLGDEVSPALRRYLARRPARL